MKTSSPLGPDHQLSDGDGVAMVEVVGSVGVAVWRGYVADCVATTIGTVASPPTATWCMAEDTESGGR